MQELYIIKHQQNQSDESTIQNIWENLSEAREQRDAEIVKNNELLKSKDQLNDEVDNLIYFSLNYQNYFFQYE